MAEQLVVTGARGPGLTELARRTGKFGALPTDNDSQVLGKFADAAIEQNPGFKGDPGPTGPADNTYPTATALAASDTTRGVASLEAGDDQVGTRYYWTLGNFTGRTDVIVSTFDGGTPISEGAWVPQGAGGITLRTVDTAAPVNLEGRLRRNAIDLDDLAPDAANYFQASVDLDTATTPTGRPVALQAKEYPGARPDLHGRSSIDGNGAQLPYVGEGKTPIAGSGNGVNAVPSLWQADPGEVVALRYSTAIYNLFPAPQAGATTLVTNEDTPTIVPPCWARVIGPPTSASSGGTPGNYIPDYGELVFVLSKSGRVHNLAAPLKYTYNSTRCLVDCFGTPIGVEVRNLSTTTNNDAYQHVIRDSIDCRMVGVRFEGSNAVGAATFSHNLTYEDCHATGSYGPFSSARGMTGVTSWERCTWEPQPAGGERTAWFIEESFEHVRLIGNRGRGAFSMRQVAMTGTQSRPQAELRGNVWDTSWTSDMGPFQVGNCSGVDWIIDGDTIMGPGTMPASYGGGSLYPGFGSAKALAWFTSNLVGNTVIIRNTKFICTNGDGTTPALLVGGGFAGRMMVDVASCTFVNCMPPSNDLRLRPSLAGTIELVGGTRNVAFSTPIRGDQSYSVALSGVAGETYGATSKTANGFTITSSNAASTALVDWSVTIQEMGA